MCECRRGFAVAGIIGVMRVGVCLVPLWNVMFGAHMLVRFCWAFEVEVVPLREGSKKLNVIFFFKGRGGFDAKNYISRHLWFGILLSKWLLQTWLCTLSLIMKQL